MDKQTLQLQTCLEYVNLGVKTLGALKTLLQFQSQDNQQQLPLEMAQTWVCLKLDGVVTSWGTGEWGEVNDNSAELTGFGLTASLNADGLLSFANKWLG